jgi:hypothetical protein
MVCHIIINTNIALLPAQFDSLERSFLSSLLMMKVAIVALNIYIYIYTRTIVLPAMSSSCLSSDSM